MMTPEQFAYWLQGFVELHGDCPNEVQWQQIKDHLGLVFNKVTPTYQYPVPSTDHKIYTPSITQPGVAPLKITPMIFDIPYDFKPSIVC